MGQHMQYSPDEIAMSWLGIDLLGVADGDFVTVAFAEDAGEWEVGAGGDATWVANLNQKGVITVTLLMGSSTNDLLSAKSLEDRLFKTGFGPFLLKDLLGTTLVTAPIARIGKIPDITYSKAGQVRAWPFKCAEINAHVGSSLVNF